MANSYTILTAQGGLNGTFGALTTTGLPAGFKASLAYTSTDALLDLTAVLGQPGAGSGGLNQNQQNVATALNNFFNSGGTLPPQLGALFGLSGANLANALSALDGEVATGAQRAALQMTDQFLLVMLDPFVAGGGYAAAGAPSGAPLAFAPEGDAELALPYGITPQFKAPAPSFSDIDGPDTLGSCGNDRPRGWTPK